MSTDSIILRITTEHEDAPGHRPPSLVKEGVRGWLAGALKQYAPPPTPPQAWRGAILKEWRRRELWAAAILALWAVSFPVCMAAAQGNSEGPNVILIIADQLQADRIHAYGNLRPTSPNIDRLAESGVRFSHFFTVGSWTAPSFAALHTSLFPSRNGVTLFWHPGAPLIDKDTPVMTEQFKNHGYYTTAFVNNSLAGESLTGRGFDEYYEGGAIAVNVTQRLGLGANVLYSAPATLERAISWLDAHRSQRFFLYVHFWEPHSPYNPPPQDDLFKSDAYPYMSDTGYDVEHAPLKRLAMLGDQKAIERLYQLVEAWLPDRRGCVKAREVPRRGTRSLAVGETCGHAAKRGSTP